MLFNLYLDYVLRVFIDKCQKIYIAFSTFQYRILDAARNNKRNRTDYRGTATNIGSAYADDLQFFFEDANNLTMGANLLNNVFKRFGLNINASKTKTMIIINSTQKEYPETVCKLGEKPLENVKTFKCLGNEIEYNQPKIGSAELNNRINSAKQICS